MRLATALPAALFLLSGCSSSPPIEDQMAEEIANTMTAESTAEELEEICLDAEADPQLFASQAYQSWAPASGDVFALNNQGNEYLNNAENLASLRQALPKVVGKIC